MVNVRDFDIKIPTGDMLVTIFNHQRDLMDKYHEVEQKNIERSIISTPFRDVPRGRTWLYAGALDPQDRFAQMRFKEFAWRITEEITEATLALDEEDKTHYLEELIDALHFSVELLCLSAVDEDDILEGRSLSDDRLQALFMYVPESDIFPAHRYYSYLAVEKLGEAMNRLKLKPWKSTAILTDETEYKKSLVGFFQRLIQLMKISGFTAESLTAMYLNKNAVNQFRIRSNY